MPPGDTWPLFFHEAAESHRATFPARADEYGDNVRAKLEHAQTIDPADVERARESVRRWREYRPDVDLYVSPTLGVEIPPEDCSELDVRIARVRVPAARSTCSAGPGSRSATCSSSRRATRSCSRPASRGSAA